MTRPTWHERQRVEREARTAALRDRIRLGTADHYRFDIFDEIDAVGIWLMFQPLKNLYGFYQRIGDAAGIVVHSGHPTALQRYTAAHEYGHHSLGHLRSIDGESEIEGNSTDCEEPLQEMAAQAFAGALLMPLHLVRRACAELAIDAANPSPVNVYDLALRFGVSYRAMRTQFWAYGMIGIDSFRALDLSPLRIKTELGDGEPPADHRAELWVINEHTAPACVPLQVADELIIRVVEARSTGYRWLVGGDEPSLLRLVDDLREEAGQDGHLGASRTRSLRFRALQSGHTRVHLGLSRAFKPDQEIQSLDVDITIAVPVTGDASSGLFADQQVQIAARQT